MKRRSHQGSFVDSCGGFISKAPPRWSLQGKPEDNYSWPEELGARLLGERLSIREGIGPYLRSLHDFDRLQKPCRALFSPAFSVRIR